MSILNFIKRVCVQPAVYWEPSGYTGFGSAEYHEPREIMVRWDDVAEKITNNNGEEVVSRSRLLVQEQLAFKGYLWLGELKDVTIEKRFDPRLLEDAYEIQRTLKTPLFRSVYKFVYEVYL